MRRGRSKRMLLSAGAMLTAAAIAPARAQQATTLEEISVTSVSPIQGRAAAPPAQPPAQLPASLPPLRAAEVLPVVANTFSPVTVVPQERIARDQPRTLGDALFDRPGISAST